MKNILILNTSFNNSEGSGVTVSNLFSHWNPNNLSNAAVDVFENKKICKNYFKLKQKNNFAIENNIVNNQVLDKSVIKSNSITKKLLIGLKNFLALFGILDCIKIDDEFITWIKNINPNAIYAVPYTHRDINFLLRIKRKFNLPLIIHFYDDWIKHESRYGYFKILFYPLSNLLLKRLIKKADLRLSISEKMKAEYEKRYKTSFYSFHNPVDIDKWHKSNIKNETPEKVFFIGTVGEHNYKEFELFSNVLYEINLNHNLSIYLHIYGYIRKLSIYKKLSLNSTIILHKPIQHSKVAELISKSDLLFLPLSFNKDQKNYIQYSMPTKTTEFMASGTPIIVFSPKDFALTEYAETKNWAYVVSEFSKEKIHEKLMLFIKNKEMRKRIRVNAFNTVTKNHEIVSVSGKLYSLINDCIK